MSEAIRKLEWGAAIFRECNKNAILRSSNATKRLVRYSCDTLKLSADLGVKLGEAFYEPFAKAMSLPTWSTLEAHKLKTQSLRDGVLYPVLAAFENKCAGLSEEEKHVNIAFDSMKFRKGVAFRRGMLVIDGLGTDVAQPGFLVAEYKSHMKIKETDGKAKDRPPMAQNYMVHYLITATGKERVIVARHMWSGLDSDRERVVLDEVICACSARGFTVIGIGCDGASENRSLAHSDFTEEFELVEGFSKFKGYRIHPCDSTKRIYFLSDPMHLVKKIRNALLHSFTTKNRSLRLNGHKLSLAMLKTAWAKTGGADDGGLNWNKLSRSYFDDLKGAYKMKVYPACQVLSQGMIRVINQYCKDGKNIVNQKRTKEYSSLLELCRHMDVFIDILNSTTESKQKEVKSGVYCLSKGAATDTCLDKLSNVLKFFTAWKTSTKCAAEFIPYQSFEDLNYIIQGNISLFKFYSNMYPNFKWRLACTGSDGCERHFANVKNDSHTGSNPVVQNILSSVNKSINHNLSKNSSEMSMDRLKMNSKRSR